jgi:DNA-binding sugar fermentation-stimulating protein
MSKILYKLDNLVEGKVFKRPSTYIKSPYVSDVKISDKNINICASDIVLTHSPSLGCCGLADKDASVLIVKNNKLSTTTPKNQNGLNCEYVLYLSIQNNVIVGIHPKTAELLVESALNNNYLSTLENVLRYKRETSIYIQDKVDSRFDFSGIDQNGIPFIMEVKNVPLAQDGIAYFPDGFRKISTEPISPRALKHITELTYIKKESKIRCIMCYVIQRTDVNLFQPSDKDPLYKKAFKEAIEAGIEIITMVVKWNKSGEADFIRDDLPFTI